MSDVSSAKPYGIAKRTVWKAYQQVRANRGAAGIDDESIEDFERHLSKNLYKVWNRMSSGSYFPPPVKQVEIPKASGGTRKLGVPTVADRVAQTVVKLIIEARLEAIFHPDSYGYRPGRSAKQAVAVTRERCWRHDWVVEFDIKAAFDRIDHALLMKAVRFHIKEDWILLYIERWLVAPFETADGMHVVRAQGTPQGGVISPILMNLFMHYAFDAWMQRSKAGTPFARYADDAVVHCRSRRQAEYLLRAISVRLDECGLELHPEKSKIVYCKDSNRRAPCSNVSFAFLGFDFRPRRAINQQGQCFTSFLPGASSAALKRMRQQVRDWRLTRQTHVTLAQIAKLYNAVIQGWWNYYGAFYPTVMFKLFAHIDRALARWAGRKYKSLSGRKRRCAEWLGRVRQRQPWLFYHWRIMAQRAG